MPTVEKLIEKMQNRKVRQKYAAQGLYGTPLHKNDQRDQ